MTVDNDNALALALKNKQKLTWDLVKSGKETYDSVKNNAEVLKLQSEIDRLAAS